MLRADFKLLRHIGHDKRLTDGLATVDRQRLVGIGAVGEAAGNKSLPRHLLHRAKHSLIADATAAQRKLKLHTFHIIGWRAGGHCSSPSQGVAVVFYHSRTSAYTVLSSRLTSRRTACGNGTKRRSPALRRQHGVLNGQ